jgi:hypothetical protein
MVKVIADRPAAALSRAAAATALAQLMVNTALSLERVPIMCTIGRRAVFAELRGFRGWIFRSGTGPSRRPRKSKAGASTAALFWYNGREPRLSFPAPPGRSRRMPRDAENEVRFVMLI